MVFGVEIIHQQADPAGDEHQDSGDNLSSGGDGLLENVQDCQYCQYYTGDVDNASLQLKMIIMVADPG